MQSAAIAQKPAGGEKRRSIVFAVLMLGVALTSATSTAMNNMLPTVMSDLGITASTAQWLVSGYTLASAVAIAASAFLIRRLSTRRLFLLAMGLYCAGSAVCASAAAFPWLLTGRVLQGLASGVLIASVQVVILALYPKDMHGTVLGIYSLCCMVMPVVTPTVVGAVLGVASWRLVFAGLAGLALAVIASALAALENVSDGGPATFDLLSWLLVSLGICSVLFGVGNVSVDAPGNVAAALPVVAGAVCVSAFCLRQLRIAEPLIDIRVFRHKRFAAGTVLTALMFISIIGCSTVSPLLVQNAMGETALTYALATLPCSVASPLASLVAGRLCDKFGPRREAVVGFAAMTAGYLALAAVSGSPAGPSLPCVAAAYTVAGLGGSLCMPVVRSFALSGLSPDDTVSASAVVNLVNQVASASASILCVLVMTFAAAGSTQLAGIAASFAFMAFPAALCLALSLVSIRH